MVDDIIKVKTREHCFYLTKRMAERALAVAVKSNLSELDLMRYSNIIVDLKKDKIIKNRYDVESIVDGYYNINKE